MGNAQGGEDSPHQSPHQQPPGGADLPAPVLLQPTKNTALTQPSRSLPPAHPVTAVSQAVSRTTSTGKAWACRSCTYVHRDREFDFLRCAMCGTVRTAGDSKSARRMSGDQGKMLLQQGLQSSAPAIETHTSSVVGTAAQASCASASSGAGAMQQSLQLSVPVVKPLPAPVVTSGAKVTRASGPSGADAIDLFFGETAKQKDLFDELLDTERSYVRELTVVVVHFLQPLEMLARRGNDAAARDRMLSKVEVNQVFSNISSLLRVNSELLSEIERLRGEPQGKADPAWAYATAFAAVLPFFKLYSIYCKNYASAIESLKDLRESRPAFAQFLVEASGHEQCRGLDLQSFLIKPVQRLCKYPLFFRDLLKKTDELHISYASIEACLESVSMIASQVNQAQADADECERQARIALRIDNLPMVRVCVGANGTKYEERRLDVLAPGRHVLWEFECAVSAGDTLGWLCEDGIAHKNPSALYAATRRAKRSARHVFLLTDLVIMTKQQGEGQFKYKAHLPLADLIVEDEAQQPDVAIAGPAPTRQQVSHVQ